MLSMSDQVFQISYLGDIEVDWKKLIWPQKWVNMAQKSTIKKNPQINVNL
jgi:hypothetical protein